MRPLHWEAFFGATFKEGHNLILAFLGSHVMGLRESALQNERKEGKGGSPDKS